MTRSQSAATPMLPWWMVAPSRAAANCLAVSAPWEYPTATLTPRLARRVLIADPIPRAPPVMSATCPSILAMGPASCLQELPRDKDDLKGVQRRTVQVVGQLDGLARV